MQQTRIVLFKFSSLLYLGASSNTFNDFYKSKDYFNARSCFTKFPVKYYFYLISRISLECNQPSFQPVCSITKKKWSNSRSVNYSKWPLKKISISNFIVDEGVTERSQVMKTSRKACAYKIKNQVSTNKLLYVESKAQLSVEIIGLILKNRTKYWNMSSINLGFAIYSNIENIYCFSNFLLMSLVLLSPVILVVTNTRCLLSQFFSCYI